MAYHKALKTSLIKEFDIKNLGEIKSIIGLKIYQDFVANIMKIDQSTFI